VTIQEHEIAAAPSEGGVYVARLRGRDPEWVNISDSVVYRLEECGAAMPLPVFAAQAVEWSRQIVPEMRVGDRASW
jgi:hypothetical protein